MRPGSLRKALPKGTDSANAQYVFRTVRPLDYSTPYDTMLKHGVQFTAVERQQSMFITVAVSSAHDLHPPCVEQWKRLRLACLFRLCICRRSLLSLHSSCKHPVLGGMLWLCCKYVRDLAGQGPNWNGICVRQKWR